MTVGSGWGSLTTAVVRMVTVVRVGGMITGRDTTSVPLSVGTGSLVGTRTVVTGGGGGGGARVVCPWPGVTTSVVSVTVSMMVSVTIPQAVGTCGVSVVPGTSPVTVVPGTPVVSVVPGVPGVVPGVSVVPGTLGVSVVPGTPGVSVVPGVPGVPGVSGVLVAVGGTSTVTVVSLP